MLDTGRAERPVGVLAVTIPRYSWQAATIALNTLSASARFG